MSSGYLRRRRRCATFRFWPRRLPGFLRRARRADGNSTTLPSSAMLCLSALLSPIGRRYFFSRSAKASSARSWNVAMRSAASSFSLKKVSSSNSICFRRGMGQSPISETGLRFQADRCKVLDRHSFSSASERSWRDLTGKTGGLQLFRSGRKPGRSARGGFSVAGCGPQCLSIKASEVLRPISNIRQCFTDCADEERRRGLSPRGKGLK